MRILITGGAGFIGHNFAKRAAEAGHEVRVLDDFSTGYRENLRGLDLELVDGSLLDETSVRRAVSGVDSIVHLGALGSVPRSIANPLRTHAVNATGTLTLMESARRAGISHVIFSSSSSVYGANRAMPKREREWVRPMSPYAVSKLAAEQYVLAYQQSFGFETLAFRFFNVYGPGQRPGHVYAAVIPVFLDAAHRNQPLWINGDGSNSRDFTYVGTVCDVLLDAVRRRISHPEPVNLAFGTNTPLSELAREVGLIVDRPIEVRYRDPRPGDVPHSQADPAVLRALFPQASPTTLREGLSITSAWLQDNLERFD